METIRNNYPLPALRGSGDVYTSEESVLLASANEWNPRPVFQSYTAYTPVLLRLNEQHLRGKNSPDWVLLDLQTIDGRLPSLDDGASWPALFDNYSFVSYDGRYVLLRRGPVVYTQSNYTGTYKEICKIGQAIVLPKADGLQFAEVDLKPTLFGRLLTAIFSPPQLRIVLHLADGSTRYHRVVGNMMETGFLLSPFVGNTKDFAALFETNRGFDRGKRVESISIAPTYGGTLFWANTYELTLRNYIRKRDFADEIAPGE
jgi:hypothetical protein